MAKAGTVEVKVDEALREEVAKLRLQVESLEDILERLADELNVDAAMLVILERGDTSRAMLITPRRDGEDPASTFAPLIQLEVGRLHMSATREIAAREFILSGLVDLVRGPGAIPDAVLEAIGAGDYPAAAAAIMETLSESGG